MPTKNISFETGNAALDLAMDTIKIGKQALVFVNTKRSAEKTAEDISKKVLTWLNKSEFILRRLLNINHSKKLVRSLQNIYIFKAPIKY